MSLFPVFDSSPLLKFLLKTNYLKFMHKVKDHKRLAQFNFRLLHHSGVMLVYYCWKWGNPCSVDTFFHFTNVNLGNWDEGLPLVNPHSCSTKFWSASMTDSLQHPVLICPVTLFYYFSSFRWIVLKIMNNKENNKYFDI